MSTLVAKLGVTALARTLVIGPAPDEVVVVLPEPDRHPTTAEPYDVIVAFNPDRRALDLHVTTLSPLLSVSGGLWLCWLKRASKVPTDIGEADVRSAGLGVGLVDNKIAAIDESWSGLRFVRRLADR